MEASDVAESDAIAAVGDTLLSLLREEISKQGLTIALASPGEFDPDSTGLSLFLYDVTESRDLSNRKPQAREDGTIVGSALALELSYLLTAHPADDVDHSSVSESTSHHDALGEAMTVFREHAILSGSTLKGSLGDDDRLHISMDDRTAERTADVWSTFQETPYQPSVSYVVAPVIIDIEPEEAAATVEEVELRYRLGVDR